MVTIELDKCTGCGTCVRICHEHCMTVHAGKISIDYRSCSTCTQCVAACPERALSWNSTAPLVFDSSKMPAFDQMDELLKQRRTVRHFGPERVSRSVLERLAKYCAYAPTHSHEFRIIIIDDMAIVDLMDKVLTRYTSRIHRLLFKPRGIYGLMKMFAPAMKDEYFRAKTKLEAGVRSGSILRSRPAAFMALVGSKRIPLNLESAQYAIYNLTLMAQTMGLGCRNLVGNQSILSKDREFRKVVNLGRTDRIFGLVGIGYPSVKYKNKVEGRMLPIQWNGVVESREQPIEEGGTNT
jgi:NAD-dependent dihydropyrimidine dehydrogenase PreA subunit/nitroreductase